MAGSIRCERCGAPLAGEGPASTTCAACLMELALAESAAPAADAPPVPPASADDAPQAVGPYRVLRVLGEGGMGIVYLAEQTEPIRRRVALKVIKRGMDTRQVIARFETERQSLALMDHPAIAKVFDAGETERGRPFFAMEFVDGEPITTYCDRLRLTIGERLELFVRTCEGVQHAHQKGIIHRDLTPSNVLVTRLDDRAAPKIIDFGVAKAIEQRLAERTMFTELGVLIGTPEYMSPEQARVSPLGVDTRTDVYSLGVLLYELLVGELPFDSSDLREQDFDEILRRVREVDPPTPSERLRTLGATSTASARRRRLEPATLRRAVSGDLDWITMKALEKDLSRRYGSAAELALDVRRYLDNEPVLARPPSALYQLQKLIARNRLPAALVAVFLLALIGFAAGMGLLYRNSERNLARALAAESEAADEAELARQVSDFMIGVFEISDPGEARGNQVTARELLDQGALRVDTELESRPGVRAELMGTIGSVYRNLGLHEQAEPLAAGSLETLRELFGETHPKTLRAADRLGLIIWESGSFEEAEKLLLETLREQREQLGDDHPDTLSTRGNLAALYLERGRYDDAEAAQLEVLNARRRQLGEEHRDTLLTMSSLGHVYYRQSRYADAIWLHEETLEVQRRVLGDDHPDALQSMHNLAMALTGQGDVARAESIRRELVETRKRVLGETHPHTISSMNGLAILLAQSGRYEECVAMLRRILDLQRQAGRADHPHTLVYEGNLAHNLTLMGRYDEAESIYRRNIEAKARVFGPEHPTTLLSRNNLGNVYLETGRFREAQPIYGEVLAVQRRTLGDEHMNTLRTMSNLAAVYAGLQRTEQAEALMLETLRGQERVLGEDHPQTGITAHNLANLYRDRDKPGDRERAHAFYERANRIWESKLGANHPYVVLNLREHAKLLRAIGDEAGATAMETDAAARQTGD